MRKYAVIPALILSCAVCLSACKGESTINENLLQESSHTAAAQEKEAVIHNYEMPQAGEKIAVITVKDYGEIKIKFFPELAPKAVENFIGLSEMGYYDELIFHRVISNFMNQTGDPRGDGTGGKSLWGEAFDGELGEGLYHFSGAVAYAHPERSFTNGSQFYIVNTPDGYLQNTCEELMEYNAEHYNWAENVVDMYNQKGGVPFLDGDYTVFGQVFEGMDVVREIGKVQTDENDKPLTQVKIESVKIIEYAG